MSLPGSASERGCPSSGNHERPALKRSYGILVRQFRKYLLPTLVTTAALSLNEFADSMLVSNLLGSQAMAVVNLGYPVMLLMTAIETLCGSGGSTCYALLLGERKGEEAGKVLFLSLAAALLAGLALMAAGMLFPDRLRGFCAGTRRS